MRRIGLRLLSESRQKIAEGSNADSIGSRDLLSLLVRANMAKDIPEAQRLSEEDVLARKCSVKFDCHLLLLIQKHRGADFPCSGTRNVCRFSPHFFRN